ncbi:PREDICTED: microfibrillar-associated protein 1-like [Amphimedon queenslandica]|uniref:Micro-fibrillar-associated protein 1 C-terminal domain-containing protein n=1 Tax=Amphimedon queenslandica TaxID=400682 RepID=A0A1X7V0B9_AMPQE|nr:PREDICTED: microfibrillar-associated protein 1-like [Amphimedon queenslandica]|eukprot:XP_019851343.1 PREDICTED: microfibrillar-associated protein 1-like [Amphimedon queenslandica]
MESKNTLIQSTAGAVPVRNEKGELRMEKVKVTRYVSGKRPAYAQEESSSDSNEESEEEEEEKQTINNIDIETAQERLNRQRLLYSESESEEEEEEEEEEGVGGVSGEEGDDEEVELIQRKAMKEHLEERQLILLESDDEEKDDDDDDDDDEAIDRRRELMRERAKLRTQEELLADGPEEDEQEIIKKEESEESSEYEDYSDSDNEQDLRLKPVFVRKTDRVTIKDERALEQEDKRKEKERKVMEEKRKKESNRLLQQAITEDLQQEQGVDRLEEVVNTDNENEEEEYEAWKIRELQRIKRDREELEQQRKEREEMERVRNMSEEQRLSWLKSNPKTITNSQVKGNYKFLQKYYHRGVFYLDEEDEVFKRNFAEPTLEDHFDKSILPQVMQVKNFGMAGRTKYTHLVDQDTTTLDNPWTEVTPINLKFQSKGGGVSENFHKPTRKKQRTE